MAKLDKKLKTTNEVCVKLLILKSLSANSSFLWITLLINQSTWTPSLKNQGFSCIAQNFGNFETQYKSTTCERYRFYSN
jgi:glutaminase